MATKPIELVDEKFDTDVLVSESTALSKGISGLIPATKNKGQLLKILADENAKRLLMTTMTTFVSVDMRFDVGMRSMGEILFNILKGGEEIHRKAIAAICEAQGIPTIEYNPKAPRKSLSLALFAKFPEMAEQVKGGNDTKGALRLTSYIAAYKDEVAKNKKKKRSNGTVETDDTPAVPKPRSAYDLFALLLNHTTQKDRATFLAIVKRTKIDYAKWMPAEPAKAATAPAGS